ncbi:hypothetical protein PsYK624_060770 [Phanerochaete sordida]|uniref:Uncharacterized protein n=1 Tax=Phanerochaete sordida TaxID=48140 RepID=A0A9P3G650_9APHY|nr:hypothetical protein PsYK624_060770 [Phanerochaete sordida]
MSASPGMGEMVFSFVSDEGAQRQDGAAIEEDVRSYRTGLLYVEVHPWASEDNMPVGGRRSQLDGFRTDYASRLEGLEDTMNLDEPWGTAENVESTIAMYHRECRKERV